MVCLHSFLECSYNKIFFLVLKLTYSSPIYQDYDYKIENGVQKDDFTSFTERGPSVNALHEATAPPLLHMSIGLFFIPQVLLCSPIAPPLLSYSGCSLRQVEWRKFTQFVQGAAT